MTAHDRRSGTLALAIVAITFGLAACGGTGSSSPPVADVSTTTIAASRGGGSAPVVPKTSAAGLLVEWATCMRSHGDPNQPDPTIDSHKEINITIPGSAESLSHAVHNGTAPCNGYLAAASSALRAGARNLTPPDQASLLKYAQCMRANGVPNYPDPGTSGATRFNATGIDPNSPLFKRAGDICGKKIHAPSWWTSGTGPPGDISVGTSNPRCRSGCVGKRA